MAGFGLYVHWPFCAAKCPYCDFNSHVSQTIDHGSWQLAYEEELRKAADETPDRTLRSIYFGGGTPSLMEPHTVSKILQTARDLWTFSNDIEITLEANPTSVESDRFSQFSDAGVNRLSLGLQSLDDGQLKKLGRQHSVAEGLAALDIARSHFDRVSVDLMYGLQHQSLREWDTQLDEALSWDVSHLSLYQLTIEPGTVFGARFEARKLPGLPDDDTGADFFDLTRRRLNKGGYEQYEISNFSKPGQQSRHNQIYWQNGDYVGIGPGAHGRLTLTTERCATEQTRSPHIWLAGNRSVHRVRMSSDEYVQEFVLMGLRTSDGVDLTRLNDIQPECLNAAEIRELSSAGWIELQDERLRLTQEGRPLLNAIALKLLS